MNLEKIPALVLPKPSELENLLLMSNIHALREQWDYFTIAQNLKRIILLIVKETGFKPNEAQLSAETGLSRGQIRRCQLLIDLPPKYAEMLLKELALPKSQQRITEDFFIEMEKALKTVRRRLPAFEGDMDQIRDTLVAKFRGELIENVLDFRQLSKIATAVQNIGIRKSQAESALQRLFSPHESVGIRDVYEQAVGFGYDERKASQQVAKLNDFFEWILEEDRADRLDEEFLAMVRALYERVRRLLGE